MAVKISVATTPKSFRFDRNPLFFDPKSTSVIAPTSLFLPTIRRHDTVLRCRRRKSGLTVCFVMGNEKQSTQIESCSEEECSDGTGNQISTVRVTERMTRKKSERFTYLIAAVMSSLGITSMAVMAVYYRFSWQMEGGEVPLAEMFGTFALSVGAAVGMEFWARWAHKALWHASLWHMHEGLGITVFGMAYMFVHDGLVHRRFAVGPIANVPYLRKVAAAHQLHHSEKFQGVPYGLFLGPKELEEVGGLEELEKEIKRRIKQYNS